MHLVVPFAAPLSDPGRAAMQGLTWPHLSRLLAGAQVEQTLGGDELSLSTPSELCLAQALGWPLVDGLLPWAGLMAQADGVTLSDAAQGSAMLSLSHWHLGTEQISLGNPDALQLDEAASRALLQAASDLFTSEGFTLRYGAPTRWYLQHPSLLYLPTASLDRVIGRNIDRWLGSGQPMRLLRRLQNEVQMLLHNHAVNLDRERRGLLAVNSFWLSGTGPTLAAAHNPFANTNTATAALAPAGAHAARGNPAAKAGDGPIARPSTQLLLDNTLRAAALNEDWPAWATAWALLDERLAGAPWQRLSLCGERRAVTFVRSERRWWHGLAAPLRCVKLHPLLEPL